MLPTIFYLTHVRMEPVLEVWILIFYSASGKGRQDLEGKSLTSLDLSKKNIHYKSKSNSHRLQ